MAEDETPHIEIIREKHRSSRGMSQEIVGLHYSQVVIDGVFNGLTSEDQSQIMLSVGLKKMLTALVGLMISRPLQGLFN